MPNVPSEQDVLSETQHGKTGYRKQSASHGVQQSKSSISGLFSHFIQWICIAKGWSQDLPSSKEKVFGQKKAAGSQGRLHIQGWKTLKKKKKEKTDRNNFSVICKGSSVPKTALGKDCSGGLTQWWLAGIRSLRFPFSSFFSLLLTVARTDFPGGKEV